MARYMPSIDRNASESAPNDVAHLFEVMRRRQQSATVAADLP